MVEEPETLREPRGIGKYRDRIVNGPTVNTFFWLGMPPLLNQLVFVAYNVADTYWLSCYSELTVSVPRQVMPVIMLFQAIIMATNSACLSIVSQYIGAKAYKNASLEASRFFTVACISGVTLNILLLTLRRQIFTWLIFTPPEIFEDVMAFSTITAFDVLLNAIAFTYATLLQSVGDTRRPAIINMVAVAINIALDPFLILGIGPFPRLGVVGASLTDVMGKIISIIGQTYILKKSYPELKVRPTKNVNPEWVKLVLRIGLPVLAFGIMNGFAFLLQQRLINMVGIIAATAFSIGFVIINIVDAALFGLSGATSIMIGQSLGADNPKKAREVAFKTTVVIFILVAVGACLIFPFRRSIASVFASDPNIINETEQFLLIVLPTLPFFGLCMNAMSVGRGSGHTAFPTAIDIGRTWTIRVALGYSLAFIAGMGAMGIWLTFSLSNVVGGIIVALWVKYGKWDKAIIRYDPK
ncbi:MAG: MATE family efflux transporter [Nitrososphaerota archaeon]|nr:MATE family efflux transporter [Candidatus Bathyarchaeota archaeon]MDW8023954.1 MATE family efflux transporter [Nitrososphaerota archaeon]